MTTDLIPFGENAMEPSLLFENRKIYKDGAFPIRYTYDVLKKPVDTWGDHRLYGRVDQKGHAVYVSNSFLKPLTNTDLFAIDFVADSFNRLAKSWKLFHKGAFGSEELVPIKAWTGVDASYHEYIAEIYKIFSGTYMHQNKLNKKVSSFKDFLPIFINFIKKLASDGYPVTKSGYITSNFCGALNSGLAIEIASLPYDSDLLKYRFMNEDGEDPDHKMELFLSAAKTHGFTIDKAVPWRLIANLASPIMHRYMINQPVPGVSDPKERGSIYAPGPLEEHTDIRPPVSPNKFFNTYYYKSYDYDIYNLKVYAIQFYNSFVKAFPKVAIPTACRGSSLQWDARAKTAIKSKIREGIEPEGAWENLDRQANKKGFSDSLWIDVYTHLRSKELVSSLRGSDLHRVMKEAKFLNKKLDFGSAMRYINTKLLNSRKKSLLEKNREQKFNEEGVAIAAVDPDSPMY